jgi:hypothetical protein
MLLLFIDVVCFEDLKPTLFWIDYRQRDTLFSVVGQLIWVHSGVCPA